MVGASGARTEAGAEAGAVADDVAGDVAGNVAGDVAGDVARDVAGDVARDVADSSIWDGRVDWTDRVDTADIVLAIVSSSAFKSVKLCTLFVRSGLDVKFCAVVA